MPESKGGHISSICCVNREYHPRTQRFYFTLSLHSDLLTPPPSTPLQRPALRFKEIVVFTVKARWFLCRCESVFKPNPSTRDTKLKICFPCSWNQIFVSNPDAAAPCKQIATAKKKQTKKQTKKTEINLSTFVRISKKCGVKGYKGRKKRTPKLRIGNLGNLTYNILIKMSLLKTRNR